MSKRRDRAPALPRRRCLAGVGRQERDDTGREHEAGAGHERALVPVGRRLGDAVVAGAKQPVGVRGGQGGEDRQAQRGAELLARVQEPRRETGPVLADTGVRCRGRADEDSAEAERGDQQAGQDVGDVGAATMTGLVPMRAKSCDEMPAAMITPPVSGRQAVPV